MTTVSSAPKGPSLDFSRITLGEIDRKGFNWTLTTMPATKSTSPINGIVGAREGYDSLDVAIKSGKLESGADNPTVAVFAAGERFFLAPVGGHDDGSATPYDNMGGHKERYFTPVRNDLRALVDADFVLKDFKVGTQVKFPGQTPGWKQP